jgi:hypothetical protein
VDSWGGALRRAGGVVGVGRGLAAVSAATFFGACRTPSSAVGEGEGRGGEGMMRWRGRGEAAGFAEFVGRDALTGYSCKPEKTTPVHG